MVKIQDAPPDGFALAEGPPDGFATTDSPPDGFQSTSASVAPKPARAGVDLSTIEKPLQAVGFDAPLFPRGEEFIAGLPNWNPHIKKAVGLANELVPTSVGETALMLAGGKVLGYGASKLGEGMAKVGSKVLSPEASMAAQDMLTLAEKGGQKIKTALESSYDALLAGAKKVLPNAASSPAAVKAAQGVIDTPGFAGGINLDKIGSADVREVIKQVAPTIKDQINKQTRGVISNEKLKQMATDALARASDISPEVLKKALPGDILNPENMLAAREILHSSAQTVFDLSKVFNASTDPVTKAQALQAFQKALARHQDYQIGITGLKAEAGRLLQQQQIVTQGKAEASILKTMAEENAMDPKVAADLASKIGNYTGDDISNFVSKNLKATWQDMVAEGATAFKLWTIVPQIKNAAGNTLGVLTRLTEKSAAPFIDFLRTGGGTIKPRNIYFKELPAEMFGEWQGFKKGASKMWDELAQAMGGEAEISGRSMEATGNFKRAIPGTIGKVIRAPFSLLNAIDIFARSTLDEGARWSLAYRQAVKEGLSGIKLAERMEKLIEATPANIAKASSKVADEFTYQSKLGPITKHFNEARKATLLGKLLVPFFPTSVNIGKFIGQRVPPFSLLSPRNLNAILKVGGAESSEAMARILVGGLTSGVLVAAALEGRITGSPPENKADRDALERTGWLPHSIYIPGKGYISHLGFDPVSTPMSMAGDIAGYIHRGDKLPNELAEALTFSILKNMSSQSYVMGIKGMMDAVIDPERSMGKFARQTISGFIPTGLGAAARATDRTIRAPKTILESIKTKIPSVSEQVRPLRNVFGEPKVREEAPLSPVSYSSEKQSPIEDYLKSTGIKIEFPSLTVNKRRLLPDEWDNILAISGPEIKQTLNAVVKTPAFQRLSLADQTKFINTEVLASRTKAQLPYVIPAELRALKIDSKLIPQDKLPLIHAIISNEVYRSSKNDKAKKDIIERMIGIRR